jgi:hypothetical protein
MMDSKSREMVSRRLGLLKFQSWFILQSILTVSLIPLIAIANPSQAKHLGMTYLIGFGITAFAYGLFVEGQDLDRSSYECYLCYRRCN